MDVGVGMKLGAENSGFVLGRAREVKERINFMGKHRS